MNQRALLSIFALLFTPTFAFGACSVANLTRCLDSACAINIGANPAARCQYCGTATAGTPSKSTAMKSVSAGASARYNITDKELKNAPSDPGERYVWATRLCLERVSGCTSDDVSDNYDSLIEKSCTAAGISAQMASLTKKATKQRNQTECTTEINACILNDKHCFADYHACESDADFDKYFSDCGISASGCDSFLQTIREKLTSERNTTFANADKILENIVTTYQTARNNRMIDAQNACHESSAKNSCVKTVCNKNMTHKCAAGYEYERAAAELLCQFHDTACERLK